MNPVGLIPVNAVSMFVHGDRLHRHHAVGSEQTVAGGKERVVEVEADRFEHFDAYKLIERALQVPVILQEKRNSAAGFSCIGERLPGQIVLLATDGCCGHMAAIMA